MSLIYKVRQILNKTRTGRFMMPSINPQEVANPMHITIHEDIPYTFHNFLTCQCFPTGTNNEKLIPNVPVTLSDPSAYTVLSEAEVLIPASDSAFPIPCFQRGV